MRLPFIILQKFLVALSSSMLAIILGLWLAVIGGTGVSWKQSFQDTIRLAHTISGVALDLVFGEARQPQQAYALHPELIREATLVRLNNSGISGIFSGSETKHYAEKKDMAQLAATFNQFLESQPRQDSAFYLILIDNQGRRTSYESINGELFYNDGSSSHLIR